MRYTITNATEDKFLCDWVLTNSGWYPNIWDNKMGIYFKKSEAEEDLKRLVDAGYEGFKVLKISLFLP